MSRVIKLKPVLNKKNGQISSYFKSNQIPKKIREKILQEPKSVKYMHFTWEGFE